MVAALEFDDLVPARVATSQSNRAHRRFSAGTDHTNLVDRRQHCADFLGNLSLEHAGRPETEPASRGGNDGFYDVGVRVPKNHRAPGPDVIDEFAAVLRPEAAAVGAFEENWFAAYAGKRTDW